MRLENSSTPDGPEPWTTGALGRRILAYIRSRTVCLRASSIDAGGDVLEFEHHVVAHRTARPGLPIQYRKVRDWIRRIQGGPVVDMRVEIAAIGRRLKRQELAGTFEQNDLAP